MLGGRLEGVKKMPCACRVREWRLLALFSPHLCIAGPPPLKRSWGECFADVQGPTANYEFALQNCDPPKSVALQAMRGLRGFALDAAKASAAQRGGISARTGERARCQHWSMGDAGIEPA